MQLREKSFKQKLTKPWTCASLTSIKHCSLPSLKSHKTNFGHPSLNLGQFQGSHESPPMTTRFLWPHSRGKSITPKVKYVDLRKRHRLVKVCSQLLKDRENTQSRSSQSFSSRLCTVSNTNRYKSRTSNIKAIKCFHVNWL